MVIVGVDLAGPRNHKDTVAARFVSSKDHLDVVEVADNLDDARIAAFLAEGPPEAPTVVGIDAPLSYNPAGGDRLADRQLRRRLIDAGLAPGTVMAPTFTRMAYLTLRGVCVARLIQSIRPKDCRVVEVHPAGALAIRGAPIAAVRGFKKEPRHRSQLLSWLNRRGLHGLQSRKPTTDHAIAAFAAALAAWQWSLNRTAWCHRAEPPLHPFDFAC